ncbi:hypothetical protein JCM11641_003724 [Rhodosporidiobolus odoratus]
MVTLRVRSPTGQKTISFSSLDATLSELRDRIQEETSIPSSRQDLRFGYPPKPLDPLASPSSTLADLGIRSGEIIVVSVGTAKAEPAQTPSSSSASASSLPRKRTVSPSFVPSQDATAKKPVAEAIVPSKRSASDNAPQWVEVDGGYLVLRVVPDDNSCLFRAVGLAVNTGNTDAAASLRRLVAGAIQADLEQWSEVVLGRPPLDYMETILKPASWGGAIELSILASHFGTEIWSIDVQSGRVDRFGEGNGYETFCMMVYSGIHYDALTFSFASPEPSSTFPPPNLDFDTTLFPLSNQSHLVSAAQDLVAKLRAAHAYTDPATFTLACGICKTGLTGEKEARDHAKETGHTAFTEYDG